MAVLRREQLASMLPGGSPERPIDVPSASVVEVRARAIPCPQCGGELDVAEHAAITHEGEPLRRVDARCRQCGTRRSLWFRLVLVRPN